MDPNGEKSRSVPKSVDDLIDIIKKVWENLKYKTITGLIEEIPERIRKVNQNPNHSLHFYSK